MNSEAPTTQKYQSFLLAFASGICMVLAFFPFGWGWTGWLVPVGVLILVLKKELPGSRPRLQIWLGLFVCWLALFQCVRLPHWAGYIGWPILSGFLCSYVFFFVLVTRQMVHGWKVPVVLAAPIAWTGLEYIQAHFCTGISLGMLSHTQALYPQLIQVADVAGSYAVTFFMVAIMAGVISSIAAGRGLASSATKAWRKSHIRQLVSGLIVALALIAVMISYGSYRIKEADERQIKHAQKIALVQGSIDTRFPGEAEIDEYLQSFAEEYTRLSLEASRESVDLLVWPESMFPVTDVYSPTGIPGPEYREKIEGFRRAINATAHIVSGVGRLEESNGGRRFVVTGKPIPILAGGSSAPVGDELIFYNSAILISDEGDVVSRYGKMKLVLFGEFVPLGEIFPWLYGLFPIPPGLKAWDTPIGMEHQGIIYSPSICFESTYPHLIRQQVLFLEAEGKRPDILVNLTNDGWFYGSTALDLHFANNVFRSIENRMPMLIAANTGFSGQIDSAGRVLAKGPRRSAKVLFVNPITTKQQSIYHQIGDWPAFLCFIPVLSCFLWWFVAQFLRKKLQLNDHLDTDAKSTENG